MLLSCGPFEQGELEAELDRLQSEGKKYSTEQGSEDAEHLRQLQARLESADANHSKLERQRDEKKKEERALTTSLEELRTSMLTERSRQQEEVWGPFSIMRID